MGSGSKARALSLALLLAVTAAWLVVLPSLRLTTSITHFMPDAADKRAARLLKAIAEGEASRSLVLDISGGSPERLGETASKLVAGLREAPGAKSVRSGVDEATEADLAELFSQRSPTALLRPEDLDDAHVIERLERQKARLASPLGPFVRLLAERDPLGGTLDALEELSAIDGGRLVSVRGVLFSADQQHAFVLAVTSDSAFDAGAQRAFLARVDASFRAARGSPAERLEISGVARMTVASEAQIRGDIERIGGLSTVGILLLFGVLFGSIRMVGLALVPLWFGTALAIVVTHLVFGEIHGLTLAFGTSLLGVGIDYAEHYFSHFSLTPERGASGVMRAVWPALWLGALTTLVGFAGIGFSGFPGVRQIAVFSSVAILGALFGTRWLLPPWMPGGYVRPRLMGRFSSLAERIMESAARRRWLVLAPALLTLAFLPGLARTRFVDDVSMLIALDPALVAEDARVRERIAPVDPGRFAVVVRPDEEEALRALERTVDALDAARGDGLLAGHTSLGSILRSRTRQQASFERAKASRERLADLMRRQGFVPEAFGPFFRELDRDGPALLTLDDLRASPLGAVLAPLAPRLPEGQAFVLPLRGVRDAKALAERLPDAVVVDGPALLEGAYRDVRRKTIVTLLVGLGLVVGVLVVRYRSASLVLAAFVPAVLGAAGAISAMGALGVPLNLLHLVALLLVLSMGGDYGIFVVEGRKSREDRAISLVSIVTATSSTLLSFGLLGLSPNPALRALGTTITIGLTLTTLLCPLGLAFVRKEPAA
jgi:predicted exporter